MNWFGFRGFQGHWMCSIDWHPFFACQEALGLNRKPATSLVRMGLYWRWARTANAFSPYSFRSDKSSKNVERSEI